MKWSEAKAAMRVICERLDKDSAKLGVIPDSLYLLSAPTESVNRVTLLLVYHEPPRSNEERELLYRQAAYRLGSPLDPARSVLYLTNGLSRVVLEAVVHGRSTPVTQQAILIWKPGLDWPAVLETLTPPALRARREGRRRLSYRQG